MSNYEIVNVALFGGKSLFGGRETKLHAVVSSCQFSNSCPALKAGRCAAANPRLNSCKHMKNETVMGYTSKAAKYFKFLNEWEGHEKYRAVKSCLKRFEYVANDEARIDLPHIDVLKAIDGESNYDSHLVKGPSYIDKKNLDGKAIKKIMKAYSFSLMGSKNENKEEKEEMLIAMKEIDEDLYNDFMGNAEYKINYIGKIAYLKTLKPNIELNGGWFWNGETLSKESKTQVSCSAVYGFAKGTEVSFVPEDGAKVEIKDESWVIDTTKFES